MCVCLSTSNGPCCVHDCSLVRCDGCGIYTSTMGSGCIPNHTHQLCTYMRQVWHGFGTRERERERAKLRAWQHVSNYCLKLGQMWVSLKEHNANSSSLLQRKNSRGSWKVTQFGGKEPKLAGKQTAFSLTFLIFLSLALSLCLFLLLLSSFGIRVDSDD